MGSPALHVRGTPRTLVRTEESIFLNQDFRWCAGGFDEFAYRYWVENLLWRATHDHDVEMTPDLTEYLAHYRR